MFSAVESALAAKKKIIMGVDPDWMALEKTEKGQHVGIRETGLGLIVVWNTVQDHDGGGCCRK
jgi:hypothetical protein